MLLVNEKEANAIRGDHVKNNIENSGECINNVITMEYENGVLWGSFQYVINYEILK